MEAKKLEIKPELDLRVVYPLMQAVIDTMRQMCGIEVVPLKPYLKVTPSAQSYDFMAMVAMIADDLESTASIALSREMHLWIVNSMFKQDYKEVNETVNQKAIEFFHIVFLQTQKFLRAKGSKVMKSVPSFMTGQIAQVYFLSTSQTVVLPLQTDRGGLLIEVTSTKVEG